MVSATFALLILGAGSRRTVPYYAPQPLLALDAHHDSHYKLLHNNIPKYNQMVLMAVDLVQQHAMDGGGYFIGTKATPPESPIGYPVSLFDQELVKPPRTSSYCSGSTYTVFIESLNFIFGKPLHQLSPDRMEALRMQEPDGSRREDGVKAWGWWNADGYGDNYALVQYLGMGDRIPAEDARPGDFMNISWKSRLGHSVIFLGWCVNKNGEAAVDYWASQPNTNGLGDQVSPLKDIKDLCVVRLTKPQNLFTFDPTAKVDKGVQGENPPSFSAH
jgi:hypothetical protein